MDYFDPLPSTPVSPFTHSILILVSFSSSRVVTQNSPPSPSLPLSLSKPQPSLSSLPQLAVDLIVHNLALTLVGYFGIQDYVPAVGGLDSLDDVKEGEKEGITFSVEGTIFLSLDLHS